MQIQTIVALALEYRKKYDNNIYQLLDEIGIKLKFYELNSCMGLTFNINGEKYILLDTKEKETENFEFIIAHELAHILLHNDSIRSFHNLTNHTSKLEMEANVFATVFLDCRYNDYNLTKIQKIINTTLANLSFCDIGIIQRDSYYD